MGGEQEQDRRGASCLRIKAGGRDAGRDAGRGDGFPFVDFVLGGDNGGQLCPQVHRPTCRHLQKGVG